MSDTPTTPRPDGVYDRERHADRLLELSKHTRLQGEHFDQILSATNEMEQQVQELRREMQAGFARIDSRLHNIEAREKNQDAVESRVDFVPLLKTDGTAIANFPLNWKAVQDLDDQTIDALLTDLGVGFKGLDLYNKMRLFLRGIGVKSIPTAVI